MLKIIPCAPWNFPVFRFLTGKGREVFNDFNGVFNISTVDNRYTPWITRGEYTECERYVNRKSGLSLPACPAPNQKSVPLSFPQESGTQSKLNFLFGAPQTSPC